ncbi:hypothetical protein Ciccas_011086 [Cichlidogyrus casuarinus]|uniref:Uncharacterized protein n=1 Tax=Cichlidogyrus casuarinus TaxID=1844966 RepID=A0ABD2PS97_9PLAT
MSNQEIIEAVNAYLRQRKKYRQEAIEENRNNAIGMTVLGFDGRTDSRLVSNGVYDKERATSYKQLM